MNVPDVPNPDVPTPGTPQLCCCTAQDRPLVSHIVSAVLPKAGDTHLSPASCHYLLIGVLWGRLVVVWDSLTKCTWSTGCQSRGGIVLLQWSEGGQWSRTVCSNVSLEENMLPHTVFAITCPSMVQLVRHSPPSPSSPSHNPTLLFERPINNRG